MCNQEPKRKKHNPDDYDVVYTSIQGDDIFSIVRHKKTGQVAFGKATWGATDKHYVKEARKKLSNNNLSREDRIKMREQLSKHNWNTALGIAISSGRAMNYIENNLEIPF